MSAANPYSREIRHDGLHKYRVITGPSPYSVEQKANAQVALWAAQWLAIQARQKSILERQTKLITVDQYKQFALERTAELNRIALEWTCLLQSATGADSKKVWVDLRRVERFGELRPRPPRHLESPIKPDLTAAYFQPKIGFFDRIVPGKKARKIAMSAFVGSQALANWQTKIDALQENARAIDAAYVASVEEWEVRKRDFIAQQTVDNQAVDIFQTNYMSGDRDSVKEYISLVLSGSSYPEGFPREWDVDFDSMTGMVVVEFRLPSLDNLPKTKEVKYIATRQILEEVPLRDNVRRATYDSVVYQICLRTIYELIASDGAQIVKGVVFNGWVIYLNPATGTDTKACIVSIQVTPEELKDVNIIAVDPKACFRMLKGVGSTRLNAMAPIQPLLQLNREDKRFVASRDVAEQIEAGTNLASIGWEEFEHLIREIFQKEFSSSGGEVRVTQASRDGGVDAIAFDPDPIRGGKIVIQAKRYTNPVGVSSVRDLYGTVMNEGATKGILVTTSNFGPDAYNFAKEKPLTLMDGNNLLFLLSKHGHQARIDIGEAKKLGNSMMR